MLSAVAPAAPALPARAGERPAASERRIAVALHGIEPATFERCALIRDWLDDHGVDRVTLLVIPARDMHPVGERSPEMVRWLGERRLHGDSIAQHGFQHGQAWSAPLSRASLSPLRSRRDAEFVGLDDAETQRALYAGWRVLKLAGIEPDGFVAPAYAYTPALRRALPARFRWWADLLHLHGAPARPGQSAARTISPVWASGSERLIGRATAPALIRLGARVCGSTMRLDLHPGALRHTRQMLAVESVLARSAPRRTAVTYEQLLVP